MTASQSEVASPTQSALDDDEDDDEEDDAPLEGSSTGHESQEATSLDSESNSEIAIPSKRQRPSKKTQRANKKTKKENAPSMPPKHPARPDTRKPRWSSVQESPIAKVHDSFSRKNRRKLLDLSLNTPVTVAGYNKSTRSKRAPSMSGDFSDMFGHFLDRFQAPKLKSKTTGRTKAASRRRKGMRHTRRFRA